MKQGLTAFIKTVYWKFISRMAFTHFLPSANKQIDFFLAKRRSVNSQLIVSFRLANANEMTAFGPVHMQCVCVCVCISFNDRETQR